MEAKIQEYFKKRYAESPVQVVPGHWPQFKTMQEVDEWISGLNMVAHFFDHLLEEKKRREQAIMEKQFDHFQGYCYDQEGKHTPPVNLCGGLAALQYIRLQKGLHYRVVVTDEDDCICVEAVDGRIIFPDEADVNQD